MEANIYQLHPIGAARTQPRDSRSDLVGPDLSEAEPIAEVLDYLNRRRKRTYGLAFYQPPATAASSCPRIIRTGIARRNCAWACRAIPRKTLGAKDMKRCEPISTRGRGGVRL